MAVLGGYAVAAGLQAFQATAASGEHPIGPLADRVASVDNTPAFAVLGRSPGR
jgi:hypothetical protein